MKTKTIIITMLQRSVKQSIGGRGARILSQVIAVEDTVSCYNLVLTKLTNFFHVSTCWQTNL